jgi:Ca2+-dependent lipid-binding protein
MQTDWRSLSHQLNPTWNEAFEFELGSTPAQEMIDFRVWDWDRLSAGNVSPVRRTSTEPI